MARDRAYHSAASSTRPVQRDRAEIVAGPRDILTRRLDHQALQIYDQPLELA
jgi:hypothetical protein